MYVVVRYGIGWKPYTINSYSIDNNFHTIIAYPSNLTNYMDGKLTHSLDLLDDSQRNDLLQYYKYVEKRYILKLASWSCGVSGIKYVSVEPVPEVTTII